MINANELRIGNWIIDSTTGEPFQVNRGTFEFIEGIEDQYEPINLTPEILERCEFKKQRDSDYLFENKHIQIAKVDEGFEMFTSDYSAHESHSSRTMKYLHELQNLHFSWVGEELEIKELQHA